MGNIRAINVVLSHKDSNFDKAIWFKDRKGDIFAINNNTLSIFRYMIQQKCYCQI